MKKLVMNNLKNREYQNKNKTELVKRYIYG